MSLPHIIAVDFDGTLYENKYPEIGLPNFIMIEYLKEKQKEGSKLILWTNRIGEKLTEAVERCEDSGLIFDAVNENLPEVIEEFGGDPRKIFADEYIDDHNAWYPTDDISDGYHTFGSLYYQRCILFAALVNTYPDKSWKSHKHEDGSLPFGGGWFIVGIDTPFGSYTYHYEERYWNLFHCKELEMAKHWDGHTDKDVTRLMTLAEPIKSKEETEMLKWAKNEIRLACEREAPNRKPGQWDYGCACYESALKAFESLCKDGHSGSSMGFTKTILNRLIEHKPLTPIEDKVEEWNLATDDEVAYNKHAKCFQAKRYSSLFKDLCDDGTVIFNDVNRVLCGTKEEGFCWHNVFIIRIINKMFPISFPYMPQSKPYRVCVGEFVAFHPEITGEFDTLGLIYCLTPDDQRIEINRYFKELPV